VHAQAEDDRGNEGLHAREDVAVDQQLQGMTNAFGNRVPLPPLDTNVSGIDHSVFECSNVNLSADQDRYRTPSDTDSDMPSSALTYSSSRPPLSTPGTTPAPSHLPTPRNSSPPPLPLPPAELDAPTIARERRVRKSVNYAEPKLNTYVFDGFHLSTCGLTISSRPAERCANPIPYPHR
jgi:hypothetical protein